MHNADISRFVNYARSFFKIMYGSIKRREFSLSCICGCVGKLRQVQFALFDMLIHCFSSSFPFSCKEYALRDK